MLARELQHPVREIIYRTSGQTHGPITRLMSPSDLGELIKPFVFLDLAGFDGRFAPIPMGFGWHPHSGIATVDRKSTRLNSSHITISYAVFCLKKKRFSGGSAGDISPSRLMIPCSWSE